MAPMKIAIIGSAGTLGSCTIYTLALKGLADEIVLLNTNSNLLFAHLMDITTAIVGIQNTKIWAGSNRICIILISSSSLQGFLIKRQVHI